MNARRVTPSERFVLDYWYAGVRQLISMGFTPTQAHHLSSLRSAIQSGQRTEFPPR